MKWSHDHLIFVIWIHIAWKIVFLLKQAWGRFKNAYELLNLRALKISMLYKNRIFQCMGKIFCVEFQRVPLKFHTKYLTHTWKMWILFKGEDLRALKFKSWWVFLKRPPGLYIKMGSKRIRQDSHFHDGNDIPILVTLLVSWCIWSLCNTKFILLA